MTWGTGWKVDCAECGDYLKDRETVWIRKGEQDGWHEDVEVLCVECSCSEIGLRFTLGKLYEHPDSGAVWRIRRRVTRQRGVVSEAFRVEAGMWCLAHLGMCRGLFDVSNEWDFPGTKEGREIAERTMRAWGVIPHKHFVLNRETGERGA